AILERCARGAALACGVALQMEIQLGYKAMRNNMALARRFGAALEPLGREPRERAPSAGAAATDWGDASHAVPTIPPYLAPCRQGTTTWHEHAFAECARSTRGLETMRVAANALARTAVDVIEKPELRAAIEQEFRHARGDGATP